MPVISSLPVSPSVTEVLQWLSYLSKGQFETLRTVPADLVPDYPLKRKKDLVLVSELVYRTTHQSESLTVCYYRGELYLFKHSLPVVFTGSTL